MNVNIDEGFREFIEKKIKSGEFRNADEIVSSALSRLVEDESDFEPGELDVLLASAFGQLDRGEFLSESAVKQRLAQRKEQFATKRRGA